MSNKITAIIPAECDWKDNQPVAKAYDDVYFSKHNGLEETQYIFIGLNNLKQRWESDGKDFIIAETGFGTGLNFLAASQLWLECQKEKLLHYISFDKNPLKLKDLQKALGFWPSLQGLSEELLNNYPALIPGWHRISLFNERVLLSLYFGDATEGLKSNPFKTNAWFLDGFAPSKNQSMWSESLFKQIGKHSEVKTSFATYTSASAVRKGLANVGFEVKKTKGYANKREACCGVFNTENRKASNSDTKPWFVHKQSEQEQAISIIGAGLAGAFTANLFARRGYRVKVFDKAPKIAQGASGNHQAMVYCRFSAYDSEQYRFYHQAYLYAIQQLKYQESFVASGLLELNFDDKANKRMEALQDADFWPTDIVKFIEARQASEIANVPVHHKACYLPKSGYVNPVELCESLLNHKNITVTILTDVEYLKQDKEAWLLLSKDQVIEKTQTLIIANAHACQTFEQCGELQINKIRGQVTHIPMTKSSERLQVPICFERYISPAQQGLHSLGASFNLNDDKEQQRHQDDQENLLKLKHYLPEIYNDLKLANRSEHEARVGFRCYAPDYLPIVGPLPDTEFFNNNYHDLQQGRLHKNYPAGKFQQGLYVNVAHGSRGVVSAPLAAEILFQYVHSQGIFPVDDAVRHALHPARFLIKKLKRNNHH